MAKVNPQMRIPMIKYIFFLMFLFTFHASGFAASVVGPANVLDRPDGKKLLSLNNDVDVECIALINDWYLVSLEVSFAKEDMIGTDTIKKKATLYSSKNTKIGETLDSVKVEKPGVVREGEERSASTIVAYLHRKQVKSPGGKYLVVEEYKLSARDIYDLPRKNKCTDLADCVPAAILKKRKKKRAHGPTFQHQELDNKEFGVSKVSPSQVKNTSKDLSVPRLAFEIKAGDRRVYSFESVTGTMYREIIQLYAYNGHWILEYKEKDAADSECMVSTGSILLDGVNLNEKYNLQEMFSYGYLNNKPFYLFRSSKKTGGISYAGRDLPLDYDEIHHYLCCTDSGFNPRYYKDMIAFFALKNGALYYVEAGVYD